MKPLIIWGESQSGPSGSRSACERCHRVSVRSSIGRVYLTSVPWVGSCGPRLGSDRLFLHPPDSSWMRPRSPHDSYRVVHGKNPWPSRPVSVSEPFVFAARCGSVRQSGPLLQHSDALIMSLWLLPGLKTLHRALIQYQCSRNLDLDRFSSLLWHLWHQLSAPIILFNLVSWPALHFHCLAASCSTAG